MIHNYACDRCGAVYTGGEQKEELRLSGIGLEFAGKTIIAPLTCQNLDFCCLDCFIKYVREAPDLAIHL